MYRYIEDKEFLHKMRTFCGEIMQRLCHCLKEDYDIGAVFYLVGSGARNLILQNADEPVDLDYNLEIIKCEDFEDCRNIKECTRKSFNKVLRNYHLPDCRNSTSSLTSQKIHLKKGNQTEFSMDVCITCKDNKGSYYRLICKKTGSVFNDEYYWNIAPKSKELKKRADYIKKSGKWQLVRQQYFNIKNNYLERNDTKNHPSFICYIEAVNNVYNSLKRNDTKNHSSFICYIEAVNNVNNSRKYW